RRTDYENRNRVADAPQHADDASLPDATLPAHNRRNGNYVVRVRSMAHAEQKPQTDHRQQARSGCINRRHKVGPRVRPAIEAGLMPLDEAAKPYMQPLLTMPLYLYLE